MLVALASIAGGVLKGGVCMHVGRHLGGFGLLWLYRRQDIMASMYVSGFIAVFASLTSCKSLNPSNLDTNGRPGVLSLGVSLEGGPIVLLLCVCVCLTCGIQRFCPRQKAWHKV